MTPVPTWETLEADLLKGQVDAESFVDQGLHPVAALSFLRKSAEILKKYEANNAFVLNCLLLLEKRFNRWPNTDSLLLDELALLSILRRFLDSQFPAAVHDAAIRLMERYPHPLFLRFLCVDLADILLPVRAFEQSPHTSEVHLQSDGGATASDSGASASVMGPPQTSGSGTLLRARVSDNKPSDGLYRSSDSLESSTTGKNTLFSLARAARRASISVGLTGASDDFGARSSGDSSRPSAGPQLSLPSWKKSNGRCSGVYRNSISRQLAETYLSSPRVTQDDASSAGMCSEDLLDEFDAAWYDHTVKKVQDTLQPVPADVFGLIKLIQMRRFRVPLPEELVIIDKRLSNRKLRSDVYEAVIQRMASFMEHSPADGLDSQLKFDWFLSFVEERLHAYPPSAPTAQVFKYHLESTPVAEGLLSQAIMYRLHAIAKILSEVLQQAHIGAVVKTGDELDCDERLTALGPPYHPVFEHRPFDYGDKNPKDYKTHRKQSDADILPTSLLRQVVHSSDVRVVTHPKPRPQSGRYYGRPTAEDAVCAASHAQVVLHASQDTKVATFDDVWVQVDPIADRLLTAGVEDASAGQEVLMSVSPGLMLVETKQISWEIDSALAKEFDKKGYRGDARRRGSVARSGSVVIGNVEKNVDVVLVLLVDDITDFTYGTVGPGRYYVSLHCGQVFKFFPFMEEEIHGLVTCLADLTRKPPFEENVFVERVLSKQLGERRQRILKELTRQSEDPWIDHTAELFEVIGRLTKERQPQDLNDMERLFHSCRFNPMVTHELLQYLRRHWPDVTSESVRLKYLSIADRLLDRSVFHAGDDNFRALQGWLLEIESEMDTYRNQESLRALVRLRNKINIIDQMTLTSITENQYDSYFDYLDGMELYLGQFTMND
eukprot:Rmarinus@m.7306